MDCETIQSIYDRLMEAIASFVNETIDVLVNMADEIGEILRSIYDREKERAKWRRMTPPKIQPLMLDKRPRVYRCRNAI